MNPVHFPWQRVALTFQELVSFHANWAACFCRVFSLNRPRRIDFPLSRAHCFFPESIIWLCLRRSSAGEWIKISQRRKSDPSYQSARHGTRKRDLYINIRCSLGCLDIILYMVLLFPSFGASILHHGHERNYALIQLNINIGCAGTYKSDARWLPF